MKPALPIEFSYKVADHFYAGEYPFKPLVKDGKQKLKKLIDFGIDYFIDLTSEPLTDYAEHLPEQCSRLHFPTPDYTVPDFATLEQIHLIIDEVKTFEEKIYVHCKGGHDRTGVVIATYFIHAGLSPLEAKKKFYEVFVPPVRGRYPHRPLIETDWTVLDRYRDFLQTTTDETTDATKQVEINHVAVRTLWEGLNSQKQFRRVLYMPYMDGYCILFVTDADGNEIQSIKAEDISKQYIATMSDEYFDDLPDDYKWAKPDPNDR
jgi:protein-tyrosine phosphatase